MEINTRVSRKELGAAAVGIFVSVVGLAVWSSGDSAPQPAPLVAASESVYLRTGTLPLQVSGVVKAAESTVVYAQTAGVVSELPAREGARVTAGQVLAVQATPVLDARLRLAAAERGLSQLNAALNTELQAGQEVQAMHQARSAAEIAELRSASNDDRIVEATTQLTSTLEQTTLTLTEAISYINANRHLFSAAGLSLYDQVVTDLYGAVPSYFQGGVAKSRAAGENLQALLAAAKEQSDPVQVELLAQLYEGQLAAVTTLFETGEADVFDRDRTYITDDMQTAYLQQRSKVLQALQTVQTTAATFAQVTDGVLEDAVTQTTTVAVTAVDIELAATQVKYATLIAAQSDVVAGAGEAVVAAERSLGRPTAPFAGIVAQVFVDAGQYVTPGTPLLTLVGTGAREVSVTVPAYVLSQVAVGQVFQVNQTPVGFVDRFSDVSLGGGGTVVISLTESFPVGSSVVGELQITATADVYQVPRRYVHFDTDGPYVQYADGEVTRAAVVYDAGQVLFVTVAERRDVAVVPAISIGL